MKLPSHAYVPGKTPRHDPEVFADLGETVHVGMTPSELAASGAWLAGRKFMANGFFWEAHEAFEPVWMAANPNSIERFFVQALIQLSNAALKAKMGRQNAAFRLCRIADSHLSACGEQTEVMGVKVAAVRLSIAELLDGETKNYDI